MSYFNQIPGRLTVLETLFARINESDSLLLITSVITKVELSWIETTQYKPLKPEAEVRKLDEFWNDTNIIHIVEFNDNVANIARDLMRHARTNNWSTAKWSIDSIHLATAMWTKSKNFFTYDKKLRRFESYVGIKIDEPKPGQLNFNI